jgi:hypothetical protein
MMLVPAMVKAMMLAELEMAPTWAELVMVLQRRRMRCKMGLKTPANPRCESLKY